MTFHSEFGEDAFLYGRFPSFFQEPAFYVDVGCAHPVERSNTAFLRELGWKGLHIDGDPIWAPHWQGDFIHAVIHSEGRVRFDCNPVPVLSRVGQGEPNVQTRRLDDLLIEHNVDRIGLLSIDVEGQEFEVLDSMARFPKWPPFIIAEYNTAGIGEDYRVAHLLVEKGYSIIHQTVANFIYHDPARMP
jgi:methyltransferase FkbM-like protein